MNERAVRARAGLLNTLSVIVWIFSWFLPSYNIILYLAPVLIWEMVAATLFGLTPLAPFGSVPETGSALVSH